MAAHGTRVCRRIAAATVVATVVGWRSVGGGGGVRIAVGRLAVSEPHRAGLGVARAAVELADGVDAHVSAAIVEAFVGVAVQVVEPACACHCFDLMGINDLSVSFHIFRKKLLREAYLTLAHARSSRLRWALGDTVICVGGCKGQSYEKS